MPKAKPKTKPKPRRKTKLKPKTKCNPKPKPKSKPKPKPKTKPKPKSLSCWRVWGGTVLQPFVVFCIGDSPCFDSSCGTQSSVEQMGGDSYKDGWIVDTLHM